MIKVVADTNIFISALMFGGLPGEFLDRAFRGEFQLASSPILLDELDEKLRLKFNLSSADAGIVRNRLEAVAFIVSTVESLAVVQEDADDDRVLECAIAANADYIVSGDRHLLKLTSYAEIPILTVRDFMQAIQLKT